MILILKNFFLKIYVKNFHIQCSTTMNRINYGRIQLIKIIVFEHWMFNFLIIINVMLFSLFCKKKKIKKLRI